MAFELLNIIIFFSNMAFELSNISIFFRIWHSAKYKYIIIFFRIWHSNYQTLLSFFEYGIRIINHYYLFSNMGFELSNIIIFFEYGIRIVKTLSSFFEYGIRIVKTLSSFFEYGIRINKHYYLIPNMAFSDSTIGL